jgi:signal transduction histidine kinase
MDCVEPTAGNAPRLDEAGGPAMSPIRSGLTAWASPTRQFALLSLLTIAVSTMVFGLALTHFVEQGILDREWASTAALVQTAARFYLRSGDFAPDDDSKPPAHFPTSGLLPQRESGTSEDPPPSFAPGAAGESGDRFEEFTRQVRMLPEVERLTVYDAHGERVWMDTERPAPRVATHHWLEAALAGETSVRLRPPDAGTSERVELYVPITFPGEGRVAGVIEARIEPSRVLASVRRARLVLWTLAFLSGAALYVVLYGIVWRASRVLRAQHAALVQRADELSRANAELRAVQRQLVSAERLAAFGEITAAVAHGLGNPLASIRSLAQLASFDADEGPVRDRLRQVMAATDRLAERMRALLQFGRPVKQRRIPTALEGAVRAALESVQPRGLAAGVRIEVSVPADLPKVRLDPARFEEALLCLIGNALDAMPEGGTLRLSAVLAGGARSVLLTVEDTGPGIPAAALGRVFEPFFTTKAEGTGLGLAVARKLLEGVGGRLGLESEPGRGTRAIVTLPIEEA